MFPVTWEPNNVVTDYDTVHTFSQDLRTWYYYEDIFVEK